MDVLVIIRPAVSPMDRGTIEDEVMDEIGEAGDVIGGGTELDGSSCDFSIEIFDDGYSVLRLLQQLRTVLRRIEFTRPTKISFRINDETFGLEDA